MCHKLQSSLNYCCCNNTCRHFMQNNIKFQIYLISRINLVKNCSNKEKILHKIFQCLLIDSQWLLSEICFNAISIDNVFLSQTSQFILSRSQAFLCSIFIRIINLKEILNLNKIWLFHQKRMLNKSNKIIHWKKVIKINVNN